MKRLVNPLTMIVLAAMALVLLWPQARVKAFNPQPDPPAFGLIGISYLETLQLHSYCAADVAPGPCSVRLQFSDSNGRVLSFVTASLQPNQSVSLTLRGAEVARAGRTHVFPAVQSGGVGGVVSTLESVDELSGRTNFVLHPTTPFRANPLQ